VGKTSEHAGAAEDDEPTHHAAPQPPTARSEAHDETELGVTIQSRIKTLPRKQWAVGREFTRRMKQAFDRNGVEMPYAVKPRYLEEIAERAAEAAKDAAPRGVKSA